MSLTELGEKQLPVWDAGDYSKIAWFTTPLGDLLVDGVDIRTGSTVLDVATGTGHVALAAARRFCEVTGVDLVPGLLEVARRRAEAEGLSVTFTHGDAHALPVQDGSFDYVLSAIGVMFAANQEKAAAELLRAAKPGGTIGILSWTPAGLVSDMFKVIGAYVTPAPGARPPSQWGTEDRIRELLGDGTSSIAFKSGSIGVRFHSPEHYTDFILENYGPTVKVMESLDPAKAVEFRRDMRDAVAKHFVASNESPRLESEYLIAIATKA